MQPQKFVFFFFFLIKITYAQTEKNIDSTFLKYITFFDKNPTTSDKKYLKKSTSFFLNKNWDSTLVYTSKQLSLPNNNIEIIDFCRFYRGFSFYKKKLNSESKKEFQSISDGFKYSKYVIFNLGTIFFNQKEYEKSISYLTTIIGEIDNNEYLNISSSSPAYIIGLCYILLKKFELAEPYLKKGLQIRKQNKDTLQLITYYGNIASLYYEQYMDNKAIPYFEKAYSLSKQLDSKNQKRFTSELNNYKINLYDKKRQSAKNMSVVEENRKDFKKALVYRKEMEQWKDSLNDQNKIYAVAQAEKEFAVKEKQKEVDLLQVQNELQESQRNLFLYSAIGLLLLLGIGAYFFREKIKTNKIISAQKENLNELNATKDKLFSIVSHDLRSSVNALKSSNGILRENLQSKNITALENLLQKNSAIVNGAYGLLDNLLNWALLQTDQGYFHIERLRLFLITEQVAHNYKPFLFEKELSFENSVSKKTIAFADQESLKIILRNLFDNAIKFSKPNGLIKVHSTESENYWNLIVEDTGLGMNETTRLELLKDTALLNKKEHEDVLGTGLGLSLVKSMIAKNHGKFDIESTLGKGTKMIVSLPKTLTNGQY